MDHITYGYIRVSSRYQNEERQCVAMRDAGVEKRHPQQWGACKLPGRIA